MRNCGDLVVRSLLLATVTTVVVSLKLDGDPMFAVSRKVDHSKASPRVLIQVWAEEGEDEDEDIVTNKIPQEKNKTQGSPRRKLIPNYDFPVVPVVTGKPSPPPRPFFHGPCRRPAHRPSWSWKLWFRGQTAAHRHRTGFEVDDKLGLLSVRKNTGIGDKMGEGVEDIDSEEEEEGVVEEVVDEPKYKARAKQVEVKETPEGEVDEVITA